MNEIRLRICKTGRETEGMKRHSKTRNRVQRRVSTAREREREVMDSDPDFKSGL